jgi:Xaa-Pro aminopeptidase
VGASNEELARRIGAVREATKEAGLGGLIVFSQVVLGEKAAVRYLSNYRLLTRKDYMVLPLVGEPALVVGTINHQRGAAAVSWIKDIRLGATTEAMVNEVADKISACGLMKGSIGIVGLSGSMPHTDYDLLQKALPGATFTDATELLDGVRMAKSAEEIGMVKETAEITDAAYELVLATLRPGADEREVAAEVARLLASRGVEDTLILTAKGRSFPCFVTPPGAYVFKEGDHYVFSIEIAGPSGYWSQIVRPMCLGEPAAAYERLYEAGRRALEVGAACLVPGARARDVARAVAEEVRKAGLETGLWCGHGMGLDLGDGVGLSEDSPLELREGAVITIHPHVMLPDRREGLLMGDTYIVRQGGGENLSRTKCELRRVNGG